MRGGSAFAAIKKEDYVIWHQRLGHPPFGSLASLSTVCEFKFSKNSLVCCDVCHRAKQRRNSFCLSDSRAEKSFDLIHCDLWGQYHTSTLAGCHYFLCIVDDFSHATWVYLL